MPHSEQIRYRGKYTRFALIIALIAVLDQFSKTMVLKYIPLHKTIAVIPGFFNLTHVHNPGGAFSFMAHNNSPLRHWLFLGAAILALCLILYFYHQTPKTHPFLGVALAMIFGGAVGNLIDRMRFGEVVDFLDVYIATLHWPTFNVADSAVTVGVCIFIGHMVFKKIPF
jgi:signal peptidase II